MQAATSQNLLGACPFPIRNTVMVMFFAIPLFLTNNQREKSSWIILPGGFCPLLPCLILVEGWLVLHCGHAFCAADTVTCRRLRRKVLMEVVGDNPREQRHGAVHIADFSRRYHTLQHRIVTPTHSVEQPEATAARTSHLPLVDSTPAGGVRGKEAYLRISKLQSSVASWTRSASSSIKLER